jgi:hypothetical protein
LVLITGPKASARAPTLKWRGDLLDSYLVKTLQRTPLRVYAALSGASFALAAAVVALAQPSVGDYLARNASNPDNAAPALDALIHGHLGRMPSVQPVMGPVSLILRAPFAALGHAIGGATLEYRLGAFACVWALAALALVIAVRVRQRDGGLLAPAAIVLVAIANPLVLSALDLGHPEELLAGALCVAAVLAADRDRAILTGVLLGLAAATKPWAALAAVPALLVLRSGRGRALLAAGGLAAALVAPLALADPHHLIAGSRKLAHTVRVYPWSAWWPFANEHAGGVARAWVMPWGLTRSAGQLVTGAVALGAGVAILRGRIRRIAAPAALALLAGLLLSRCLLDPQNLGYYAAPAGAALLAWETSRRRGLPVVTILACLAGWATLLHPVANPTLACALYLAWSLPLAGFLMAGPWRAYAKRPSRYSRYLKSSSYPSAR